MERERSTLTNDLLRDALIFLLGLAFAGVMYLWYVWAESLMENIFALGVLLAFGFGLEWVIRREFSFVRKLFYGENGSNETEG